MANQTDVHTRHCCKYCGCKYGEDDCSVVTGHLEQEFPCGHQYTCGWEDYFEQDYKKDISLEEDWSYPLSDRDEDWPD